MVLNSKKVSYNLIIKTKGLMLYHFPTFIKYQYNHKRYTKLLKTNNQKQNLNKFKQIPAMEKLYTDYSNKIFQQIILPKPFDRVYPKINYTIFIFYLIFIFNTIVFTQYDLNLACHTILQSLGVYNEMQVLTFLGVLEEGLVI